MINMDLYIMFNDFINNIDLKYGGKREVFINCSIRKFKDNRLPLFANQNEKRMGAPILRAIKEVGMYKAYTELYNKRKKQFIEDNVYED